MRNGWLVVGLVASLVGCDERRPVAATPPAWLDGAVMEQVQSLGPTQQLGPVNHGVTHDEDESASFNVNLEMNRCYAFSAVGDTTVEELKIYLFNPNGQRVSDKEERGTRLLASFCVTGGITGVTGWGWGVSVGIATPGIYKVELKTTEGYGHVALGVFATNAGGTPPPGPPPAAPPPAAPPPAAPPAK